MMNRWKDKQMIKFPDENIARKSSFGLMKRPVVKATILLELPLGVK